MKQAMLRLEQIEKSFGSRKILQQIDFFAMKGTTTAVTGVSGGGKSTLLSILGLLQAPDAGAVYVAGEKMQFSLDLAKIRAEKFGYLFQSPRLLGAYTVWENSWIGGALEKRWALREEAQALLCAFGMESHLHSKPEVLSLGQLRRAALVRALLGRPPVILADEPTNDLDPAAAELVENALFQAAANGSTVILVTHDSALARRADSEYHLAEGQLQMLRH